MHDLEYPANATESDKAIIRRTIEGACRMLNLDMSDVITLTVPGSGTHYRAGKRMIASVLLSWNRLRIVVGSHEMVYDQRGNEVK